MKKYPLILASTVLLITSGLASAQTKMPRNTDKFGASGPTTTGRSGVTGAPSSTNPQATAPQGARQAPHAVPESGGAPMREVPDRARRR